MVSQEGDVAGWVGKFVSFSSTGVTEEDVRFQDVWLRTFQEAGADGRFHMRMIRRRTRRPSPGPGQVIMRGGMPSTGL